MATLRFNISLATAAVRCASVVGLIAFVFVYCPLAPAQSLTVLHSFNCGADDGCQPAAPPVVAPDGTVFGTTFYGGSDQNCPVGCGAVFQVTPPPQGGTWSYSNIYEFTGGKDGCCVISGLTLDSAGHLYGVNNSLFQLTRPAKPGASWHYKDLYDFTNEFPPNTPLLMDSAGALYGVTNVGGIGGCGGNGCGTVLQFVPSKHGPWTKNVLYQFTGGADGGLPVGITMDSTGALYGVADAGGIMAPNCGLGCGTVFRLQPVQGGTWQYSVLYSFTGKHDQIPYGSVAQDAAGNLYGLAGRGQFSNEVFKVKAHKRVPWTERLIHRFSPQDVPADYCGYPPSYLTSGPNGALYGTIFGDIDLYFGAVFQLNPPAASNEPWSYVTLWDFNESGPDLNPNGVVLGPDGALYGTTNGGDSSGGTVFQLQLPSQAPWPPSDFCY